MTTTVNKDFGDRIKQLRTGADLTQKAFAARIKVAPQSVVRWEAGNTLPALDAIQGIAAGFPNVDLTWLILGYGQLEAPQAYLISEQSTEALRRSEELLFQERGDPHALMDSIMAAANAARRMRLKQFEVLLSGFSSISFQFLTIFGSLEGLRHRIVESERRVKEPPFQFSPEQQAAMDLLMKAPHLPQSGSEDKSKRRTRKKAPAKGKAKKRAT